STAAPAGSGVVTVGFLVSGSSRGTAAITGTSLGSATQSGTAFAWTIAEIQLLNLVNPGDNTTAPAGAVWKVSLDGQQFEYTQKQAVLSEGMTAIASGLANAINQSGTRFATMFKSATLKLSGTPHVGD